MKALSPILFLNATAQFLLTDRMQNQKPCVPHTLRNNILHFKLNSNVMTAYTQAARSGKEVTVVICMYLDT